MDKDFERERQEAEEHKSRIDAARDSLYQPGGPSVIHHETDSNFEVNEDEVAPPSRVFTPPPPARSYDAQSGKVAQKVNTIFRRVLIAAVAFFVLSLGAAAFMYFYGNNIISSRNITIEVTAPPSIPSSDTFSFDVTVQNGNNSDLIKSAIVIDYPEGTRYVDDNTKPLISDRVEIGTLGKGEIVKKTLSARLFGNENAEKEIKVRYIYEVKNSNAHFTKDSSFIVLLRLAPIVLSIDALKEVNNNQEVVLIARVISNSNNTLNNVALNVVYPFGFTYTRSNMEIESAEKGLYPIGEIKPNETKTVEIRGMINGQSAEDKVFKFNVGTANPNSPEKVTTSLAMYIHDMVIRGDFLASSIVFGNNKNYGTLGTPLRGTISWKNTLKDPINDAEFALKVTGDLIDNENVSAESGFYDSNKSLIEWNKNTDDELEEIAPGQTGNFGFIIPLFRYEEAIEKRITNPKINLNFDIKGQRITEDKVTENIQSSFSKTVPIITTLKLDSYSLHTDGPIKNSGPIPPKAENKTTYTIAFALLNSVNEIREGELTAKLPNYVKYEGSVSPASDKVSWNESTRLLRWNVGTIPARTGYGTTPRTLYFKVSITPSRTQINQILPLVTDTTFTGYDSFANANIKEEATNATTNTNDHGNGFGTGQVVE